MLSIGMEKLSQLLSSSKPTMVSAPVLAVHDFSIPFIIETDASGLKIEVVLSQQGHPTVYLSKA